MFKIYIYLASLASKLPMILIKVGDHQKSRRFAVFVTADLISVFTIASALPDTKPKKESI